MGSRSRSLRRSFDDSQELAPTSFSIEQPLKATPDGRFPKGWFKQAGLALVLLTTGCGKDSKAWLRQLRSEDEFERLLAAVALCEEYPRRATPAILVVIEGLESEVPRNRAAAGHALIQLVRYKLPELAEFVITAGSRRPVVRNQILPLLKQAGPEAGEVILDLLREHGWDGPPEVRQLLVQLAQADPGLAGAMVSEYLAADCPDEGPMLAALTDVGVVLRPQLESLLPSLDAERRSRAEALLIALEGLGP